MAKVPRVFLLYNWRTNTFTPVFYPDTSDDEYSRTMSLMDRKIMYILMPEAHFV